MTEYYRKDKKVSCQNCYHEFWIDYNQRLRNTFCPRCNKFGVDIMKENGKPVVELRKYEIYKAEIEREG